MEIIVLGTGCPKCKTLEEATRKAIEELGVNANVTKEEDIVKIMNYGVMRTPALVIDGKVIVSGRAPNIGELKEIIAKNSELK
ncbi:MAG TPA: thioredoxin family protein [Perlabentimonas sp.]|jgi:small redox-active disulfide protein 2|nr:thioredoxin family protein [Perlabentimonas sp.]